MQTLFRNLTTPVPHPYQRCRRSPRGGPCGDVLAAGAISVGLGPASRRARSTRRPGAPRRASPGRRLWPRLVKKRAGEALPHDPTPGPGGSRQKQGCAAILNVGKHVWAQMPGGAPSLAGRTASFLPSLRRSATEDSDRSLERARQQPVDRYWQAADGCSAAAVRPGSMVPQGHAHAMSVVRVTCTDL